MTLFFAAAVAIVVLFAAVATAMASESQTAKGGADSVKNDNAPTDKIRKFAEAIAFAEGFWDRNQNVHTASRPARNNNPGDFLGTGDMGTSDGIYAQYSTLEKGWERLYGQLRMIVDGASHNYNLDETISDMAYTYTATEQDSWSENVSSYLGVTRDTRLRGLLT